MSKTVDPLEHVDLEPHEVERWLWFFTALGVGLRVLIYLLRPPIWTDEAKLAVSLLDRGFGGLLEPFAYSQIAPVAFMWVQKGTTQALGVSEYTLRLVPLLAAVTSVLVMRRITRRWLSGAAAIFALALFAVSYYPVRHAAELKPYATDLLTSLVLTAVALSWLGTGRSRSLWLFAATAPVAIAFSYPAILVVAGLLIALVYSAGRKRHARAPLLVAALASGLVFALTYLLIGAAHQQARLETRAVWPGGFPPLDDPLGLLAWLVTAHTGRTFGYPLGAENGGGLLAFLAVATGALVLYRRRKRELLAVLILPFAAGIGAALVQRYPYGGSGRVTQYLVPGICFLAAIGAAYLTSLATTATARRRAQRALAGALVAFAALFGTAAILHPYRDRPDLEARHFARWLWHDRSQDAVLVDGWEDFALEFARPNERWVPGGPGFRVNQRIYFERRRLGGKPPFEAVSNERPLRVVFLGSSIAGDEAELERWLETMSGRYRLVGEERHELGSFARDHGEGDFVQLFELVPRD